MNIELICKNIKNLIIPTMDLTGRSSIAEWDLEETKAGGPFDEILNNDILVNCILLTEVWLIKCNSKKHSHKNRCVSEVNDILTYC